MNTKIVLLLKLSTAFVQIALALFFSSILSASAFGLFSIIMTIISFLSVIMCLGWDRTIIKYNIRSFNEIAGLRRSLIILYVFSIILFLVLLLINDRISDDLTVYLLSVIIAFQFGIVRIINRLYRLNEKIITATLMEFVGFKFIPVMSVFIFHLFLISSANGGDQAYIFMYMWIMVVCALITSTTHILGAIRFKKCANVTRTITFRIKTYVFDLIAYASRDLEIILIGVFVSKEIAGVYFIGKKLFGILSIPNDSVRLTMEHQLVSPRDVKVSYLKQVHSELTLLLPLIMAMAAVGLIIVSVYPVFDLFSIESVLRQSLLLPILLVFLISRITETVIGPLSQFMLYNGREIEISRLELLIIAAKTSIFVFSYFFEGGDDVILIIPFVRTLTYIPYRLKVLSKLHE